MRSAGLLLYRRGHGDDAVEVLLAHMGGPYWARKDERAWTIPKGEHLPDEDAFTAARREFAEELGTAAPEVVYTDLGEVQASGGKLIRIWAGESDFDAGSARSNTFDLEWPPRSGRIQAFPEIDRAEWFALDVAVGKLVAGQRPFFDRLVAHLEQAS